MEERGVVGSRPSACFTWPEIKSTFSWGARARSARAMVGPLCWGMTTSVSKRSMRASASSSMLRALAASCATTTS